MRLEVVDAVIQSVVLERLIARKARIGEIPLREHFIVMGLSARQSFQRRDEFGFQIAGIVKAIPNPHLERTEPTRLDDISGLVPSGVVLDGRRPGKRSNPNPPATPAIPFAKPRMSESLPVLKMAPTANWPVDIWHAPAEPLRLIGARRPMVHR